MTTAISDSDGLSRPSWMDSLMWTWTTRAQRNREGLRFASDSTGREWAALQPLLRASRASFPFVELTFADSDDATITSEVKAALLGDSGLKSFEISVETYKDVVRLSGVVNSDQVKARATEVAAGVSGVRDVQNNLVVK